MSGFIGMAIGNIKHQPGNGFMLGILLGPLGWILACSVSDIRPKCRSCLGVINDGAKICVNCGSDLKGNVLRYNYITKKEMYEKN